MSQHLNVFMSALVIRCDDVLAFSCTCVAVCLLGGQELLKFLF
jgi:hypothetical protein